MRAPSLVLLLGLVGCEGEAPVGGPIALELVSPLDISSYHSSRQLPTALDGTQTFRVHREDTFPGKAGPVLDLPFEVEVDDDSGIRIEDLQEQRITIRGVKEGSSALRILHADGSPMGAFVLPVAEVGKVEVVPRVSDRLPRDVFGPHDRRIVWGPGEHTFQIELYKSDEWYGLVGDSSMQIALAGAERTAVDTLHVRDATVGTSPISVLAGGKLTTIDFMVVDHADEASLITELEPVPTSFTTGRSTALCFQARNAGRYILGLKWAFTVVGDIEPQFQGTPNCFVVVPRQTSGEITVTASAAGQSVSVTLPVVAM